MDRTKKNWVNRCFGNSKGSGKPEAPPLLTEQQREERVKRILREAAARRKEKVLKALLKKAAKLKKAKIKKPAAKKIPKERDLRREGAERLINDLKKLCREGSLMDLLPMVARKVREGEPSIVLEVLLERIRRNQWDKLSDENKCRVIQAEASLGKHTN